MPSSEKIATSRRLSLSGMPTTAAAPNVTAPASRNRAVSTRRGGQSAMASLAPANAEDQRRQNAATLTDSGSATPSGRAAGDGTAILAVRMEHSIWLVALKMDLRVAIWKLNDKIISSGNSNGCYDA